MLDYPVLLLFPAALAYAAVMDIFTMTIPNRVSLALLAGFCIAAPVAGLSSHAFLMHIGAGALMLAAGVGMFALRLLGGGDAKLLAAASLWMGFTYLLPFVLAVAISGGALSILILAYRRVPAPAHMLPDWAARLHEEGSGIPYGLAICAGAFWIYPHTELFKALIS